MRIKTLPTLFKLKLLQLMMILRVFQRMMAPKIDDTPESLPELSQLKIGRKLFNETLSI